MYFATELQALVLRDYRRSTRACLLRQLYDFMESFFPYKVIYRGDDGKLSKISLEATHMSTSRELAVYWHQLLNSPDLIASSKTLRKPLFHDKRVHMQLYMNFLAGCCSSLYTNLECSLLQQDICTDTKGMQIIIMVTIKSHNRYKYCKKLIPSTIICLHLRNNIGYGTRTGIWGKGKQFTVLWALSYSPLLTEIPKCDSLRNLD